MQTDSIASLPCFHANSAIETPSDDECAAYTFVEMQNQDSVATDAPPTTPGRSNSGPSLLLRGLRKSFADVVAVDGLDLEVARGECFGLLGPNGAGKTTTIEICEGLTAPDAGTVELLGLNWNTGGDELRQRIGIQLQETQFPGKADGGGDAAAVPQLFIGAAFRWMSRSRRRSLRRSARARGRTVAAGRSSGWRWPARWWAIRSCCFSMSRRPGSIRRRGGTCGTWWTS